MRVLGRELSRFRRNVANMAAHKAPKEPLLVILGSTGTGKSDLAIELAKRYRGEVINADAMQLYEGMPVITNKVAKDHQQGIPHHLLGSIGLDANPWDVEVYKREATRTIDEIRRRGNLPILVGGTQYYVDAVLFRDVILDNVQSDSSESFPLLDEPTDVLLRELRKCDPIMADRWHPNDRRKIQRSLEIFLRTGRPASLLYEEQQHRRLAASRETGAGLDWEKLLLWVHTDRDVLQSRLDRRVDDMLAAGLLQEVRELWDFRLEREGTGLDMTKGIWQSIGFKQFKPYLKALHSGEPFGVAEERKRKALEDMKTATRRYANYQTRWIRLKQIRRLREESPLALSSLYLLDSTDAARFGEAIVRPAIMLTKQFLRGEPRPAALEVSDRAREILVSALEPPPKETPCKRTCDLCRTTLVTEQGWQRHISGTAHRRLALRRKRALVPVVEAAGDMVELQSSPSSPDIKVPFP